VTSRPDEPIEERLEERLEELREDSPVERQLLTKAIGGWKGLFDSGVPAGVFVLVYMFNGQRLSMAVWSAVAVGAAIAVLRLVRREDLTQIAGGFAGIVVSALVASRTGQAEDFFLPGLFINGAYFLGCLLSIIVGWPAIGLFLGAASGSLTAWRSNPALRRVYAAATWVWVGVFGLRLLVQLPLYLAGQTAALGVAKIVMGWPLFLLGAWFTFLIVRPVLAGQRAAEPNLPQSDDSEGAASKPSSESS
jgi:hypothetical protein